MRDKVLSLCNTVCMLRHRGHDHLQTVSYLLELKRSPAAAGARFSFCSVSITDPLPSLVPSSLSALAALFNRLAARMVPFPNLTCFTMQWFNNSLIYTFSWLEIPEAMPCQHFPRLFLRWEGHNHLVWRHPCLLHVWLPLQYSTWAQESPSTRLGQPSTQASWCK